MSDDPTTGPAQAGSNPPPPGKTEIDQLLGHAIARKFHPVVLFGGSGSGKTAMILSLLRLLNDRPTGIGFHIDPSFFPNNYPQKAELLSNCFDYLGSIFDQFKDGKSTKSNFNKPFMLPLAIKTNKPTAKIEDHIRIVLIDGMGEWFEADRTQRGSDGSYIKDFSPELRAVLESRNVQSLTTIFVAPYSTTDDDAIPSDRIINGLAGVIDKYQATRRSEANDWNLFLLTKWDRCSIARRDEQIRSPNRQYLEKQLQRRAGSSWVRYYNSNTLDHERRYVMQYIALIGDSTGHRDADPDSNTSDQAILDHYAQILLNWIYANAAQATYGERVSLFPEVDAYRTQSMPFYDRVLGWIAGVPTRDAFQR